MSLDEIVIPSWVAQSAIARALGLDPQAVRGIDSRGPDRYAIAIERDELDLSPVLESIDDDVGDYLAARLDEVAESLYQRGNERGEDLGEPYRHASSVIDELVEQLQEDGRE